MRVYVPTSREGQVVQCVMARGIKCLSGCIVSRSAPIFAATNLDSTVRHIGHDGKSYTVVCPVLSWCIGMTWFGGCRKTGGSGTVAPHQWIGASYGPDTFPSSRSMSNVPSILPACSSGLRVLKIHIRELSYRGRPRRFPIMFLFQTSSRCEFSKQAKTSCPWAGPYPGNQWDDFASGVVHWEMYGWHKRFSHVLGVFGTKPAYRCSAFPLKLEPHTRFLPSPTWRSPRRFPNLNSKCCRMTDCDVRQCRMRCSLSKWQVLPRIRHSINLRLEWVASETRTEAPSQRVCLQNSVQLLKAWGSPPPWAWRNWRACSVPCPRSRNWSVGYRIHTPRAVPCARP